MSIDRRAFVKGVALTSAAVAGGVLTGAATAAARDRAGAPAWHRAPCRLCGIGCGLLVAIQDGRAVAVKGDAESPVSRGLACVKGYHAIQALYGRDRLERALVRRNGVLVETTLAEAYALIAARLGDTIARHGADAAGVYGSGRWSVTDAYIAAKLFKGGIGTNNVDTSTRLHAAAALAAQSMTFGDTGAAGCYDDIEHADIVVLWDHNIAEIEPVLFSRLLERRRTNPAVRIVDVATRTTRTSYAADRMLRYAPHAEVALANAICHEIVQRRGVDRSFVDRHVTFARGRSAPGYGADEGVIVDEEPVTTGYAEFVRFLGEYAPDRVAPATGMSPEDIRWLASLYADRSRNVLSLWGSALCSSVRGTWANNALHNIHLLVGKVARPGNGALTGAAAAGGLDDVHTAGAAPAALPHGNVRNAADRALAARLWGVPPQRIPTREGRSAVALFRGLESGSVRFLWVQDSNPLAGLPNAQRYRRSAAAGHAFLVVSAAYPTTTTEAADVVLPAALWLEREGVVGTGERRTQHVARLLRPPGDARAEGWHTIEVARQLGHGALFPWTETSHVAEAWHELRRFHDAAGRRPAPLEAVRAGAGVLWPYADGTETGWRYNTAHDPAADRTRGAFDFHGHADHRARIWLRPHEPPAEAPDRGFPLWLVTGSLLEHSGTGTLTRRIPVLLRAVPRAFAELNREDARALGVRDGDRVRLVTRRGTLELQARTEHRSQPPRGMVVVPAFDESTPVNRLTLDACCPLSGQPDGKCAVRVEKVG